MTEKLQDVQAPPTERPQITPGHIWAITGPSIATACNDILVPHIIQGTLETYSATAVSQLSERAQGQLQEKLAGTLPHEEAFVKDVSNMVLETVAEQPNASEYVVLFDLDETTARRGFLTNRALHAIRPSAAPLMATLRGIDPRIKFGLLTSRSDEYLKRELDDPQELATLVPYLDTTKVLSSREIDSRNHSTRHLPEDKSVSPDVRSKITICENLIETSENLVVILVDDLPDFQQVQPGKNLKVLTLGDNSRFQF